MNKKILWIFGALLCFVVVVNLITHQYVQQVKRAVPSVPEKLKGVAKVTAVKPAPAEARSQEHPGIVIVKRFNKPVTQQEWDKYIQDLMVTSKMLDTDEGMQAVDKMAINPVQFQETMTRLDNESKKVEEAYAKTPDDPLLQQRLQDLYKLKALTKVLVQKGVIAPGAAELPGMSSP